MVRSLSRGSSARSTGSKPPADRPPAYGARATSSASSNAGYVVEETVTTKSTSQVESSVGEGAFQAESAAVASVVNESYDEDGEKTFL